MSNREGEASESQRSQYAPGSMSRGPSSAPPVQTTRSEPNARLALYCTKLPSTTVNSFCGAMAGMASGIVTCPLDVIKTKLQAQGVYSVHSVKRAPSHMLYNGMMGTARVIWREERFRGLYRGLGPMLLGYLPTWAVYMSVYEKSREYYYTQIENKWVGRVYASITAGACSTLATNPIWVIKTRLMSQMHPRTPAEANVPWYYRSTLDAARKMWRNEGFRAFYSGLTPALLGLSHVAIQFPLYEFFKMQFTGLEMGEASPNDHDMHWLGILGATFLSKVCATSATYPHEVLRTRLQTQQRIAPSPSHEGISFRGGLGQGVHSRAPGTASSDGMINMPRYRGVIRTARAILHEEGWRSFYNGMGTNMIRAVPAAMTTMLTFETLKAAITRLQKEGNEMLDMDHR